MSTSFRRLDHINVRVSSLAAARPFFAELLPALGFSKDVSNDVWLSGKLVERRRIFRRHRIAEPCAE